MADYTTLWRSRINRAEWVAARLRAVPFIRLVGLNGSLLTGSMHDRSDIDFYIATAKNRLFLTRLLVTVMVHLTGWRRYGKKVRGRICLNRFATVEALEITPHNKYHARVFSQLAPLVAVGDTYEQYRRANRWMSAFGFEPRHWPTAIKKRDAWIFLRRLGEQLLSGPVGDWLEERLRRWQTARILADPRTHQPGSRVKVRRHEICLHAVKIHEF